MFYTDLENGCFNTFESTILNDRLLSKFQHNFPHGLVSFADGFSTDPLRHKADCLKQLVQVFSFINNNVELVVVIFNKSQLYSVFHQYRQAKFDNGGLILSSSQFLLLPQLPQKMKLASKVVKMHSK
jgi:hypothetical protein